MNAVVHAGGGTGRVSVGADGTVQVRVEDHGAGIAMENLPRATLARGFSTKATLGHGLKMMLETVDRLYLLTARQGRRSFWNRSGTGRSPPGCDHRRVYGSTAEGMDLLIPIRTGWRF